MSDYKAGLHKVPHSDYTAELHPPEWFIPLENGDPIVLGEGGFNSFMDACENPEPPNDKLLEAFNSRLKRITEKYSESIGRLSDD